ncbi:MAG: copper amine oxidase N-terminal domain-containing protein [Eubacteriales bacterium]
MKKTTKYLLSGILASSLALSATAMVVNDVKIMSNPQEFLETSRGLVEENIQQAKAEVASLECVTSMSEETEIQVATLSSAASYDSFYSKYGYEKSADVFYNGVAVSFDDAFPLIQNGATFVPLAGFAQVIGATVGYIPETHSVTVSYQGDVIAFDIDSKKYTVNGVAGEELPYATFVVEERTMVPLRFITDAFGLAIYWNGTNAQVSTADLDSLRAGISDQYTIMDSLLRFTTGEIGKTTNVSGGFDCDLTLGGKVVTLEGDMLAMSGSDLKGLSYEMDFNLDLAQFQEEIGELLDSVSDYPDEQAAVQGMLKALASFDLNYIYDMENLEIYIQSNLVSNSLPYLIVGDVNLNIDEETWYKLSLTDFMLDSEVAALKAMFSQTSSSADSMDELIDVVMSMTQYQDNHTTDSYGTLKAILDSTKDSNFTKNGNSYSLKDSITASGESCLFELVVDLDDKAAVESYEANVTLVDNDRLEFTFAQEAKDVMTFGIEGLVSGMAISCNGELVIDYTTQTVPSKPSSTNILDLSKYF